MGRIRLKKTPRAWRDASLGRREKPI